MMAACIEAVSVEEMRAYTEREYPPSKGWSFEMAADGCGIAKRGDTTVFVYPRAVQEDR